MATFRFYHPIEVRYEDLDPQGHVNNARYLTYMEQARVAYFRHIGLWKGEGLLDVLVLLAEAQITYRAPILFCNAIRVGVRVARLGNKSLTMEYCIDGDGGITYATGSTVIVTGHPATGQTIPVPDHWRQAFIEFEGQIAV